MNTERTSSSAQRPSVSLSTSSSHSPRPASRPALHRARVFCAWLAAALLLVGLAATASQAGLKPVSVSGTGAVFALASQLRAAHAFAHARTDNADSQTPGGRTLMPRRMMRAGAILKAHAGAPSVVPISGGVQTYDVSNPPPAFRPLIGFGAAGAVNNNSANPPVYINSLTPTNLTPIWSPDETYLIFSSNRNAAGGLNADATDGISARYHLWAISVNGGQAFQITTSTGPGNGGEFFPVLSGNSRRLAFVSDAQSPGTQNLYAIGFSSAALTAGAAPVNISDTTAISSLTLRYGPGIISGPAPPTEAASSAFTGFTGVQRPAFGTSDGQLIVFSALSSAGTYAGHSHLYFLYQSTGGFSSSNTSYPGKLTDGPADDTDPTFSPDGQFIAFSTTAGSIGGNPNNTFGPTPPSAVQDPNASQSLTVNSVATRSIFLISGGGSGNGIPFGTVPSTGGLAGGRVTIAGTDDYGPAWSNFANQNQYTNPAPTYAYLAFARAAAPSTPHDIYYLQVGQGVSAPNTETLTPESGGNAAIHLNTDDNAGPAVNGRPATLANTFDDVYPSWSPFLSVFSITYSSNRTVTYNDPANSQPTEAAVSVAPGGTATNPQDATASYTVGTGYAGLLVSQVLNLDPPTLLRFSTNEVVHVQATDRTAAHNPVTGTPNKLAASGTQSITLTVRLSDREAGIDDTGGPNGGPRVYVQIKDPDSKYQDSQGMEHKVFMKDRRYDLPTQTNRPANDVTSGTANALLDIYDHTLPTSDLYSSLYVDGNFHAFPTYQRFIYPSYGTANSFSPFVGTDVVSYVNPRGPHGGQWIADTANNPNNTHLFVGRQAIGTFNPYGTFSFPAIPGPGRITVPFPGTDPNQFIPHGPEYECQLINPNFGIGGASDATPADYQTPYYLAGVDDQGAFSGGTFAAGTQKDRPNTEWLQLARVPDAQQDHNGGVLYTVDWTTPKSGSDFFVDVIAFDKASFPNITGFPQVGQQTNWRIYDNVSGFSTNQTIGNDDILVVSDYALGQKFAASTFGGRNFNLNLVPKLFGTESYLTDVDINILPDSVYAGIPSAEAKAMASAGPPPTAARIAFGFSDVVQPFGQETVFSLFDQRGQYLYNNAPLVVAQNGLGAQSYFDPIINDGTTTTDGAPNVQSQRYSIWRILSRGPVPQTVLNGYLPKPAPQPAILDSDPTATAYKNIPAATVLDARQCVIWLSPYTGDVLADPGTIDDPGNVGQTGVTTPRKSTTSILTAFVQAGGRLCVTGQDVGSTLTLNGTVNNTSSTIAGSPNFLPDVLNATLVATGSGSNVLAGTPNRITGNPFYDNTGTGVNTETLSTIIQGPNFLTLNGPIQGLNSISYPNFPYQDNLVLGDADYGDSGLSQIPAVTLPIGTTASVSTSVQGQPDVIAATNGASVAMTYVGGVGGTAMVFHDDPYNAAGTHQLPNGGTGSRVVYAGFGLEGLSNDYYSSASPNPSPSAIDPPNPLPLNEIIPAVIPRNPRSGVLHNIVNYLRTGRVSGTITQTAGTGQGGGLGIDGVTVYLRPIVNPTTGVPFIPSTRPAFSATTASGGRFTIAGVEPGTYTLVAIKPGFQRATSNSGVTFTVEGDVTKNGATLTMTPLPPANIAGVVQDTAGNQINGATVIFTSQDSSITRTVTTVNGSVVGNAAENYFLQSVPVTTYTATATGPLNPQSLPEYTAATAPDAPNAAGITVQPNTTFQPVNFTLTPILATISGTVTSAAAGTPPVPGATVTLVDSTGKTVAGPVVTGADGTYTLTNIPAAQTPTTYTVSVTAPGFAPNASLTETVYLGSVITGANVSLTPIAPGSIQVSVTYTTGGPVANAVITYTAPGGAPQTATTGADGTFTIASVPPAIYTVSAIGPNNTTRNVPTTTAAPAQQITVVSGQQATASFVVALIPPSFSGTVTDASGKPLPGVTITVTDAGGNPVATTPAVLKTGTDGTYTTGPLPQGTYKITASLAGYGAKSLGPIVVQNGDALTGQNFSLAVVPPGSITGTVKDNNGLPVAGAVVTFNSTDGTVTGKTATTDASGAYLIPPAPTAANLPASTYTGNAVGPNNETGTPEYGADPNAPKTVTVPPGGAGTVNFTLPVILASVSGTITDAQTQAVVAGATVTLTDPSGKVVGAPITTGADGTYAFTGILATQTPANYTLTVTASGYSAGSATVVISLGDQIKEPIALNEQATLIGLVTDGSPDAAGQPLPGVTLTVKDATGAVVATIPTPIVTAASTTTGSDGQPENYLANLLPGTYTITATKGNYDSQTSAAVTLTNVAPVRVNFALRSSIGTIGGLVTDQNGTGLVSGATVTAVLKGQTTGLTFTTNGSSTTGPDGNPVNYTGQLAEGVYSVTVTKGSRTSAAQTITILGGTFNRLDFTAATGLPALHTFAAGLQFISTPYDYSAIGFNGLFGTLNTATTGTAANGNRSEVAVWNPLVGAYALDPNAPADTLRLGVGYWVYLQNATPVTQQGATPTGPFVAVALGKGWNQIGVPNPAAAGIPISNLQFDNGAGGKITFAQAGSSQYNLITTPLYAYAGGGYQTKGAADVLLPWQAYWIYVNSSATLEIPIQ